MGTTPKIVYSIRVKETNQMPYTDPCTYAMQSDMNRLKEMIASDLANYMCEMMTDLNDCVDWVCDRFGLDATEELIDFVADCHDEFFGN
jgi:predicted neutral ceramidase superfamily lipid hydrolase